MKKLVTWIAIFAIVIGILYGIKFYNRAQARSIVLAEAPKMLKQLPAYEAHKGFYDTSFATSHAQAFDAAYSMNKPTAERFSEKEYLLNLVTLIQKNADAKGEKEVSHLLLQLLSADVGKSNVAPVAVERSIVNDSDVEWGNEPTDRSNDTVADQVINASSIIEEEIRLEETAEDDIGQFDLEE